MGMSVAGGGSSGGRRRRGVPRYGAMAEINMTPFIDVMLVLLIIFMVTAPLISPSVIDVPSVGKASTVPDRVITIEITKDNKLSVRSRSTGKGPGTDTRFDATLDNVAQQTVPLIGDARDTPVVRLEAEAVDHVHAETRRTERTREVRRHVRHEGDARVDIEVVADNRRDDDGRIHGTGCRSNLDYPSAAASSPRVSGALSAP